MSRNISVRSELTQANIDHNECLSADGRLILTLSEKAYGLFLISGTRLKAVYALPRDSFASKIILARVKDIKKDLGACFVRLTEDTEAFLKLSNVPEKYLPIKQGDLIPVKVISDEQKGKRISVSAKIKSSNLPEGYDHKAAYSILKEPDNYLWSYICRHFKKGTFSKILTESNEIFDLLKDKTENNEFNAEITLYSDTAFPLPKLYSLKTKMNEAISPKVYLKSGAYIVINRTEALTVIDVNSGKLSPSKKADKENAIFEVNKEAAEEIALQLRLRNISGMILIDFINMESEDNKNKLLICMDDLTKEDNVIVKVIDITPLGIMELTRQKTDKPLEEIYDLINI